MNTEYNKRDSVSMVVYLFSHIQRSNGRHLHLLHKDDVATVAEYSPSSLKSGVWE